MTRRHVASILAGTMVVVALLLPGGAVASVASVGATVAEQAAEIPVPGVGDATIARVILTSKTRLKRPPRLRVANGSSLAPDLRVFTSVRALNKKRKKFEALVIVAFPAQQNAGREDARRRPLIPVQYVRIVSPSPTGIFYKPASSFFDTFGEGTEPFVCEAFDVDRSVERRWALTYGPAPPSDVPTGTFGQDMCRNSTTISEWILGQMELEADEGVWHVGPGLSFDLGMVRVPALSLIRASFNQTPDAPTRAIGFFTDEGSQKTTDACSEWQISSYGSYSLSWQVSHYGRNGAIGVTSNVGPQQAPLPSCAVTGNVTGVEQFGCFAPGGSGYIGWEVYGTPGTRFHVKVAGEHDLFFGANTAIGTGVIPASGELYTGAYVRAKSAVTVTVEDSLGEASETVAADAVWPIAPEAAGERCRWVVDLGL